MSKIIYTKTVVLFGLAPFLLSSNATNDFVCKFKQQGFDKYDENVIPANVLEYFLRKADSPRNDSQDYNEEVQRSFGRTFGEFMWPNGRVPIEINVGNSANEDKIWDLLKIFQQFTCVRFVQREEYDQDYVALKLGPRISSSIGYQRGQQETTISKVDPFEIYHVLMHVLGFVHQHQAPNRDSYVTVKTENIPKEYETDFSKLRSLDQSFGAFYDYLSVTHYPQRFRAKYAFDKTIEAKDPNIQLQAPDILSQGDIWKINAMYKCPDIMDFNISCNETNNNFILHSLE